MQISLRSTPRWLLFGCCTLLAITEFMYLSTRAARAHAWAEGVQQWQIERSVALEPQNSEYWYRLGNWHLLMDLDSVAALNAYSEAVRQNTHTASPYLDMARASLIAGDRNLVCIYLCQIGLGLSTVSKVPDAHIEADG